MNIWKIPMCLSIFILAIGTQIPLYSEIHADLVLINGKIITMEDNAPFAESLAIKNGKIIAIGSNSQIKPFISKETRIIDLEGKTAMPGLIDSHGHFGGLGESLVKLDLRTAKNWDEIISMIKNAVKKAKPGEWILGRGWHQEKWDKPPSPGLDGLPIHDPVSELTPNNPVFLEHASGHSVFVNKRAMELAQIDAKTPNPEGGEIIKNKSGQPIGIFLENAMIPFDNAINRYRLQQSPSQIKEQKIKELMLADQACLQNGITSFHDAGSSFQTIDLYRELFQQKKLNVRLNVMISESNEALSKKISQYRLIGLYDNHLTVRSIKRLIDGALGSHSAWLLQPYDSLPGSTGLNTESIQNMKETAQLAIENGFQVCTHAIGDRANRETLNIYEEAFKAHPDKTDLRWRIEHAQHIDSIDIPRFGKLHIIAAMQTIHCTSDGPWVIKRLGEKRSKEGAYPWRKLIDSQAIICNGTDVPVESVDPMANIYAAVTRKMKDGKVFFGEQCMTRLEALRSYTINGAYASFEENIKGSLALGKLADIIVISKDILTVPAEEIPQIKVLYTIIGGVVHQIR